MMRRADMLSRLEDRGRVWDFVIIGGGATGLGVAIDAAARGYQTLLLEQNDFAKGTSSRSTKLAHGGVRYLKQGNVSLVLDALRERGLMRRNAPHLVHDLPFVVPVYDWWEGPFYGIGLRVYDLLAGKLGFGRSRNLSRDATVERIPTIEAAGLRGGVIYYDGQFDDARLAISLAQTAVDAGATVVNYVEVFGVTKANGVVSGVRARDGETGREYEIRGKVVVNAAGVYSDSIRRMDDPEARAMISPSQGTHIVLGRSFLPGDSAIMIPQTDDGRVLFAIPWHDCVVVGTTDNPVNQTPLEPRPMDVEIEFLLSHAARYLTKDPSRADVLSAFAGLRPLVSAGDAQHTAALSRDHTVHISESGLLTITGGKWTTYRKMAEDAVDHAADLAGLDAQPCPTRDLHIHGYHASVEQFGQLAVYGSDGPAVQQLMNESPEYLQLLHPQLPYRAGQVIWAVREEMARTVEDVLSRRTRALLLNARASIEAADRVADLMAGELGWDKARKQQQIQSYRSLASQYVLA
ncbi:MAG TPA: glycerol-3-phosphate dehydrogenase/oxidase [Tepidisphaeraceae bacterium]|nr:glycerol-3-phosphate dehydrogenase/oxidase [Tepidisphaeraceae bacterium]